MDATDIFALAISAVSVVGAIASAIFAFRKNASGIQSDVITTYKERVKQLEERVTTCEGLHRINLEEMGKMKGAMSVLETTLKDRENILKERNPETEKFMAYLTKVATDAETYMAAIETLPEVLAKLNSLMAEISKKLSRSAKKKKIL